MRKELLLSTNTYETMPNLEGTTTSIPIIPRPSKMLGSLLPSRQDSHPQNPLTLVKPAVTARGHMLYTKTSIESRPSILTVMQSFPYPHASVSLTTPAGRTRLHSLTLSDLDGGFIVDGCGPHPLFDLSSHGQEGLFDIRGVLRGCLQERNAKAVGEFLYFHQTSDFALARSIDDKDLIRTFATVYSTTFLSDISLLLPTNSLFTPSVAYRSIS